jgi:pilus assembly protein CpaF
MNADRVIVGEVLGDEVLPMLNAMSQGRSGSMCTIHADSSAGVFRRISSYAVQARERIPLEASNLLIAGAIHFVVQLDSEIHDGYGSSGESPDSSGRTDSSGWSDPGDPPNPSDSSGRSDRTRMEEGRRYEGPSFFPAAGSRQRFVSSIREVVDAEGVQVISNEVFRPGPDRRAVESAPLRPETSRELEQFGYRPHPYEFAGSLR